jgi:CheY-like chemotaxis protein
VDDDTDVAEFLTEVLLLNGHHPTAVHSAKAALERVVQERFDVVFSDFRMPDMTGREFLERLRDAAPSLAQRLVFLTGDTANEETQFYLRTSGRYFLAKPFHIDQVEEVVRRVMTTPMRGV